MGQHVNKRPLQSCGTRAAYARGCRCEACRRAANDYAIARRGPKWRKRALQPCGTLAAYRRGCSCDLCRAANTAAALARLTEQQRAEISQRVSKWRTANPGRRRRSELRKYGLTPAQFQNIFDAQGNCCGCCKATEPTNRGWVVDHDHVSGAVRGVLCSQCNLRLGHMGDSAAEVKQRAHALLQYLNQEIG